MKPYTLEDIKRFIIVEFEFGKVEEYQAQLRLIQSKFNADKTELESKISDLIMHQDNLDSQVVTDSINKILQDYSALYTSMDEQIANYISFVKSDKEGRIGKDTEFDTPEKIKDSIKVDDMNTIIKLIQKYGSYNAEQFEYAELKIAQMLVETLQFYNSYSAQSLSWAEDQHKIGDEFYSNVNGFLKSFDQNDEANLAENELVEPSIELEQNDDGSMAAQGDVDSEL